MTSSFKTCLLLLILFVLKGNAQIIDLKNANWQFHQVGQSEWFPATIPGTVHTDLLNNKKINDPFYRTNERDLQWIDKEDWEYKTSFEVNEAILKNDKIDLVFEGLDTYADVYVNGSKVIAANNMFLSWTAEVKSLLKRGDNQLEVYFYSPIKKILPQFNSLGYTVPVSNNDQSEKRYSVFSRKAGYHFGWDWGPRFVTSGIWRPAYLKAWSQLKIEDLFIKQLSLSDDKVFLETQLGVVSTSKGIKVLQLFIDDSPTPIITRKVLVTEGSNSINVQFDIIKPELWWPNGMGAQKMYHIKAQLLDGDREIANKVVKHGVRTIEIVQENNLKGQSFYFKVNGKPVFMKGANYIPQDNFLPRVTKERYEHVINTAAQSNMNMLRVWGGGIYENDVFYDLCDEKGILIWQDFMFACSMYPPYEEMKRSIYDEAVENVKRLRNHPSIALYCGNNEIIPFMTSHFWNHVKVDFRSAADSIAIFNTYADIFHSILPSAIKAYDDQKFYWSCSPNGVNYSMDNNSDNLKGDAHYWGVWWGKHPFERYNDNIAPFMSEYGFQSFPELETIKTYALPEDYAIESEVMNAHQRSTIGNGTIAYYMKDLFRVPQKFENFLYVGQVLQSEGIKIAIESHRRAKPFCMGSLFWQIDDCWPVASWSSMDYYGRWKAQQYMAKKAYQPFLISPFIENDSVKVYAVSDEYKDIEAMLQINLVDFSGKILRTVLENVRVPANTSTVVYTVNENELTKGINKLGAVMNIKLMEGNRELSVNNFYFAKPKELNLPKPKISLKAIDKNHIEVTTDKLARFVWLQLPKTINAFSDNYFDLLPGEKKIICLSDKEEVGNVINKIKVLSLVDTY